MKKITQKEVLSLLSSNISLSKINNEYIIDYLEEILKSGDITDNLIDNLMTLQEDERRETFEYIISILESDIESEYSISYNEAVSIVRDNWNIIKAEIEKREDSLRDKILKNATSLTAYYNTEYVIENNTSTEEGMQDEIQNIKEYLNIDHSMCDEEIREVIETIQGDTVFHTWKLAVVFNLDLKDFVGFEKEPNILNLSSGIALAFIDFNNEPYVKEYIYTNFLDIDLDFDRTKLGFVENLKNNSEVFNYESGYTFY